MTGIIPSQRRLALDFPSCGGGRDRDRDRERLTAERRRGLGLMTAHGRSHRRRDERNVRYSYSTPVPGPGRANVPSRSSLVRRRHFPSPDATTPPELGLVSSDRRSSSGTSPPVLVQSVRVGSSIDIIGINQEGPSSKTEASRAPNVILHPVHAPTFRLAHHAEFSPPPKMNRHAVGGYECSER